MQNKMKLYPFKFEDDISVLNSDSIIANGFLAENSIDDVIETYLADLLGPKVLEYYRGELPVTVRISDINDRLPVMACPDDAAARERYMVWGRPFLWYFSKVKPGAKVYYGFKEEMDPTSLYNAVMDGTVREKMYSFTPHEGDSLYVKGGMAFSADGDMRLVEISQNSPVTYHLEEIPELGEAMDILDYSAVTGENPAVGESHFTVNLRDISKENRIIPSSYESFIIYVCVGGAALIKTNDDTIYELGDGEVIFIPESMEDFVLMPADGKGARVIEVYMTHLDEPEKDSYTGEYLDDDDVDDDCGCGHHHNH